MTGGGSPKSHAGSGEVRIIVKKKKGHGGHHGGAWKVAYADFITALMALFLLLWLVGSASDEQKKAIAGYFRDDPIALPGQPSPGVGILPGATMIEEMAAIKDSLALESTLVTLKRMLKEDGGAAGVADQVLTEMTAEGLKIDLVDRASDVLFAVGSTEIRPEASNVLEAIAGALHGLPNKISIGGHTDSRPYNAQHFSNWELSTERANRARQIMSRAGLEESRLAQVAGYADTRPLVPREPESPKNRRISITVLREHFGPGERIDPELPRSALTH